MKVTKTDAELREHLREQVQFLRSSCVAFDKGELAEAKRLAVNVRVLAHDTAGSTSLLTQLNQKEIDFLDTSSGYTPNIISGWTGLLGMNIGPAGTSYRPHYDSEQTRWLPFGEWWGAVVLSMMPDPPTRDSAPTLLTRRDVVLTIADQEGGAHVDKGTNAPFAHIAGKPGLGWTAEQVHDGGVTSLPTAHGAPLFSMRQIAHEVLRTLEHAKLCDRVDLPTPAKPIGALFTGITITRQS